MRPTRPIKLINIDQRILDKFDQICFLKKESEIGVVENALRTFIGENYDFDSSITYVMTYGNVKHEKIKIIGKDKDFLLLSNGNKINVYDFEILYQTEKGVVDSTLEYLKNESNDVIVNKEDIIDADFLKQNIFNPNDFENWVDKLDVNKINFKPGVKSEIRVVKSPDPMVMHPNSEKETKVITDLKKADNLRKESEKDEKKDEDITENLKIALNELQKVDNLRKETRKDQVNDLNELLSKEDDILLTKAFEELEKKFSLDSRSHENDEDKKETASTHKRIINPSTADENKDAKDAASTKETISKLERIINPSNADENKEE